MKVDLRGLRNEVGRGTAYGVCNATLGCSQVDAEEQHKADAPDGAQASAASADTSAFRHRVAVFSRSSFDSRESSGCPRPRSGRNMTLVFSSHW